MRHVVPERLHLVPVGKTGSGCTHRGCWVPSIKLASAWPTLRVEGRQRGCQLRLLHPAKEMSCCPLSTMSFWGVSQPYAAAGKLLGAFAGRPLGPLAIFGVGPAPSPGVVHPAQTCRRGVSDTAGLSSVMSAPGRGHATPVGLSYLSSRTGRWLHSPGQAALSAQPRPWLRPFWQLRLPGPEHAWLRWSPDW